MMRSMLLAAALTVLALAGASGFRGNQELPQLPTAASVPPGQEAELTMRWFGTSTVSISDGPTTIMIDGFFSRPRMRMLAFAWLGLPLVRPDQASIDAGLAPLGDETIEAIFVAHAHHDHALDTGRVARRDDARVYGSVSVAYIVDQKLDGATVEPIWDGFSTTIGAFEVRVIASPHKPSAFGPAGDITQPLPLPANLRAFRSGPSFSFLITHPRGTVLVMPSAVIDGAPPTLEGQSADVVLLGIGLLGRESEATMRSYWKSVV
jgi:L-ascorbate metabolism protein UlaG (beta-lactamase superfamily)